MRAHEWTRARQRPVRHLGGSVGKLAEAEHEAPEAPEPSLLSDEAEPESEPSLEEPETAEHEELRFVEAPAFERAPAEEAAQEKWEEEPEVAPAPKPPPARPASRGERPPARRKSAPARQEQLPLQLEPVPADTASKRSATETREDLIQRLLDPHLSLQETAKLLNVCPTTVRRYTNRGLLAHYRTPGNQRRFRLSDVLAFMERQGIPAHGLERKRPMLRPEDDVVHESP